MVNRGLLHNNKTLFSPVRVSGSLAFPSGEDTGSVGGRGNNASGCRGLGRDEAQMRRWARTLTSSHLIGQGRGELLHWRRQWQGAGGRTPRRDSPRSQQALATSDLSFSSLTGESERVF